MNKDENGGNMISVYEINKNNCKFSWRRLTNDDDYCMHNLDIFDEY
jgi:hypothetical protein